MDALLLQTPSTADHGAWYVVGFGVVVLIWMTIRPRFRRRDPLDSATPQHRLAQQRNVERQMESLLVEMAEMARQITGQLDTRAKKLELLIEEADRRLNDLRGEMPQTAAEYARRAVARMEGLPGDDAAGDERVAPLEPEGDDRHAAVYRLADEGHDVGEIARRLARPRGEIELILALRRRTRGSDAA